MVLYYILVPLAWLVWHIGFRIRVEGRENLKKVHLLQHFLTLELLNLTYLLIAHVAFPSYLSFLDP